MFRCAVLDDYQHYASEVADWGPIQDRVQIHAFTEHFFTEDDLVSALAPFDIIVLMRERTPFPASVLERLPKLKLLVTTSTRNAVVDMKTATARGVTVCGTEGLASPTVEFAWTLILGLARNLVTESNEMTRGGAWQTTTLGADLGGRTLGILGLGKIGSKMAAIANVFGMNVQAWSQNLTPEAAAAVGAKLAASKEALLESSDFVTVHLVLGERTRGLIGETELRRMKPTAFLINTSRAPIVDKDALVKALNEGWIAGAAVDVFDREPLPLDDRFRRTPRLLATPHLGHVTRGSYEIYYRDIIDDIRSYLDGAPVRVIAAPGADTLVTAVRS
jgi:phosphoglycerate dehydrogenase-like enzyme